MAASWTQHFRHRDYSIDGANIMVALGDRSHRVTVSETDVSYLLRSVVLQRKRVRELTDLPLTVWTRNRDTSLVGFRIDETARLIAEAWLPKTGLTTEEFRLYVRTVAEESDRFEYQLTGLDKE